MADNSPRSSPHPQKKPSNRNSSHSSPSNSSHKSKRSSRSKDRNRRQRSPPFRKEPEKIAPSAKLFVTNIDSKYTQEQLDKELRVIFNNFGPLKNVIIKTKAGSANSYCFIEYQNLEDAVKAQEQLKGKDFRGKELKVEFGRGQRKTQDRRSDKCYICHKEGHFAKDCKYNRYNDRYVGRRSRSPDDRYRERDRRDDRRRGDRDRHDDRGHDRDRHYRDQREYRGQRRRRRSYSSSSESYDRRHRREDYRRHRDSHRSPDRPDRRRHYRQGSRRYD